MKRRTAPGAAAAAAWSVEGGATARPRLPQTAQCECGTSCCCLACTQWAATPSAPSVWQASRSTASRRPEMTTLAPCRPAGAGQAQGQLRGVEKAAGTLLPAHLRHILAAPSCLAISRPMPLPPPVTSATLWARVPGLKGDCGSMFSVWCTWVLLGGREEHRRCACDFAEMPGVSKL